MSRLAIEILRGSLRWLSAVVAVAIAPKCMVCLAAYAGVDAALGAMLGRPEICGAAASLSKGEMAWFTMVGVAVGVTVLRRWRRTATTYTPKHTLGGGIEMRSPAAPGGRVPQSMQS